MSKPFGKLLSICNRKLIKLLNRELAAANLNLTRDQFVVLMVLWKHGAVNQQEIANELEKEKYSITKLIDGLEKRELVRRSTSNNDRRINIIELTEKSIEIKPQVIEVVDSTIDKSLMGISEEDMKTTKKVLEQIIVNIKQRVS